MSPPASGDFLAERMALAFGYNRRAAAINGALALLSAWAMAGAVPRPQLALWLAAVGLALLLRLAIGEARRHDAQADARAVHWAWRIALALGASGLAWGLGAAQFAAQTGPLQQAFWVIALCGIGSGAVSGLRFFLPALWLYLVPLLLPMVLHYAATGAPTDQAVAGGLALFLVFSLGQGRSAARALQDSLAMRADNARLVTELTARHHEAQQARQQAEEAAAAKARFFAAASHDLRQPLQALVLLDAALADAPAAQRPVLQSRLSQGIHTLDRLFEAVLAVSTLQARAAAPPQGVAVAPLALALAQRYRPQAEAAGLQLDVRMSAATGRVPADPAALERLLGNLLANALRFTPAGGRVLLTCRQGHHGTLRLQVRDNGCGIAADQQSRVFEAFYQVGNAHRSRDAGTGLGLAIVQRLADDLGGRLSLRSAPGRGSCFELRLALAVPAPDTAMPMHTGTGKAATITNIDSEASESSAAVGPVAGPGAGPLAQQRVWIIDDDALVRESLAALLGGWGLQVLAAEHPEALPDSAAPPHWLLCDRMLAGVDGLDLALALQQGLQPPPRVLMLSGQRDAAARATAQARGWLWLDKPVRPMALRACLASTGH